MSNPTNKQPHERKRDQSIWAELHPRKRDTPTKAERRAARRLAGANEGIISEFGDGKRVWKKTPLGKVICHRRPGSMKVS